VKARALVAASGARDASHRARVRRIDRLESGRYFVSLLQQLGYESSLKVIASFS
jgi:hypothetical protein